MTHQESDYTIDVLAARIAAAARSRLPELTANWLENSRIPGDREDLYALTEQELAQRNHDRQSLGLVLLRSLVFRGPPGNDAIALCETASFSLPDGLSDLAKEIVADMVT